MKWDEHVFTVLLMQATLPACTWDHQQLLKLMALVPPRM
jgi:hypothetical protein